MDKDSSRLKYKGKQKKECDALNVIGLSRVRNDYIRGSTSSANND